MKLLLDENLSRRIVPFLQEDYPGSTQVALLGMERATDQEIWDYARENGYVIVTRDSDFYDMSLVMGFPPHVLWLRTGNSTKDMIIRLLLQNRRQIESMFRAEEIGCIELSD